MTFTAFEKLIKNLEELSANSLALYKLGIDISKHDDMYHSVITSLIDSLFSKEGAEWISWYLYERMSTAGKELEARDASGERICHTLESLYETVMNSNNEK